MADVLSEGLTPKQLAEKLGVPVDDLTAEQCPTCPKCGSWLLTADGDEGWLCTSCREIWSRWKYGPDGSLVLGFPPDGMT